MWLIVLKLGHPSLLAIEHSQKAFHGNHFPALVCYVESTLGDTEMK